MGDKSSNSGVDILLETIEVNHELDTSGLCCPEPVMLLHKKVQEMVSGEVVRVIATDPSTQRDIPKFCIFLNHYLLMSEEQGNHFYYVIKKVS
ncbi:MAG: sulfurtransferase TusA [Candidatus Endonucleobacter sp. (ex Gigantidas childressi)]|nr:sulfurtransferase TusA [Candidatus Endonucleobacter sp. (ex Gigantidas childressi)]